MSDYVLSDFKIGDRVQLHPATDAWMRGDTHGTIERLGRTFVHVRMDRSGRLRKTHPRNIHERYREHVC